MPKFYFFRALFIDRVQSAEELQDYIKKWMNESDQMTFERFKNLTEAQSSTLYLSVINIYY